MPRDHLFIVFGNAIAKTVPEEEFRRCISRYVQENKLSREESKPCHEMAGQERDDQEEERGNFKTWPQILPYTLFPPLESGKAHNCFDS